MTSEYEKWCRIIAGIPSTKETTVEDQAIEQEIQTKGLTAPRVTPQRIEEVIDSEHYFTAANGAAHSAAVNVIPANGAPVDPLCLLTICVLVLKNGFTVTGESACASPENFDAELGRKIARKHATDKIWALEGYALKNHLARAAQ